MWMLLAAALCAAAPTPAQRIAVMPTRAGPGASPDMAQLVDVRLGTSLTRHGRLGTIITSEDLNRLTVLDDQRRALGCGDETCARELGAAFDSSHVLTSVVSVTGDRVLVVVTLVPVDGSTMVRLEDSGPNTADALLACVDRLVDRLEAQAAPPPSQPAPSPAPAPAPKAAPDPAAAGFPHHLLGLVGGITAAVAGALATVACLPLLPSCAAIPWLGSLSLAAGTCVTCLPLGTILMLVGLAASVAVPVAGFRAGKEHLGKARAAAGLVLATGSALGATGILALVVGAVSLMGSTSYLMSTDGLTTLQNASATQGSYPAAVRVPLMVYFLGAGGCLLGCCALPPAAWLLGTGGLGAGGTLMSRDNLEDEDSKPRRKKPKSKRKKKHVLDEDGDD